MQFLGPLSELVVRIQIQFDLFINNIKSKKIDKDHIKLIHQSHNFISELSKNV